MYKIKELLTLFTLALILMVIGSLAIKAVTMMPDAKRGIERHLKQEFGVPSLK